MSKKIIALIGSTRGRKTASESVVNYLFEEDNNVRLIKYRAHEIFNDPCKMSALIEDMKDTDLIFISSPVYLHSIPYPLTVVLEILAQHKDLCKGKKVWTVIHCGYPEDIQREVSFEICMNFARTTGMQWLGGIGFGASPLIDGRPLVEVSVFTKWIRKSLDEMRKSIHQGCELSPECYRLAKKHFPPIPKRILATLMNAKINGDCKKKHLDLFAQPHLFKEVESK